MIMRHEDKLKEKVGQNLPYTVPEGYFKSFKTKLIETLPEYPEKPVEKKLTAWQRVKPYVYLAAMFAGIWCMMQIFHRVSTPDTPSESYAYMVSEPDSYDFYVDSYAGDDLMLEDEVMNLYPSMDEFKRDFYAQM